MDKGSMLCAVRSLCAGYTAVVPSYGPSMPTALQNTCCFVYFRLCLNMKANLFTYKLFQLSYIGFLKK